MTLRALPPPGILHVALDDRDLVALHRIELEILLHPAVDLLRQLGANAGIRQIDADPDLLCLRQAGRGCQHAGKDKFPDHVEPSQVTLVVAAGPLGST